METIPVYGSENSRMVKFSDMCNMLFYLNGWPNNRLIRITTYSYTNIPAVYLYIGNQNGIDNGEEPICVTLKDVNATRTEYIQLVDIRFKIGDAIPDYWRLVIESQTSSPKRITFEMKNQASELMVYRNINTTQSTIQLAKESGDKENFSWETVYYVNLTIHS